jgi:hypothetical protein
MTNNDYSTPPSAPDSKEHGNRGHGGHQLMMIACCIPMLIIAGLLFATGVAGSGVIFGALLCTVMMAAMMFSMPGGHGRQ